MNKYPTYPFKQTHALRDFPIFRTQLTQHGALDQSPLFYNPGTSLATHWLTFRVYKSFLTLRCASPSYTHLYDLGRGTRSVTVCGSRDREIDGESPAGRIPEEVARISRLQGSLSLWHCGASVFVNRKKSY